MKILELTNYTAGGCGVGGRVLKEAELLSKKGHTVKIFSSNLVKGSKGFCRPFEILKGVEIQRFPAKKLGGESFLNWDFKEDAKKFKPDIIIAHTYRHLHTTKALKLAKNLGAKILLVTHAPFGRGSTRTFLENKIVSFYDSLVGKRTLKKFDKILIISNWERKYLESLGVAKNQIAYIPNGVGKKFFRDSKIKEKNNMIYTGRVSPIKNLEIVIQSLGEMSKKIDFEIFGPAEEKYLKLLKEKVREKGLNGKIKFTNKLYDMEKQINALDSSKIFILPSKTEGMPQTLIEAMARGKIILASDNPGSKDLITSGEDGFLFKMGDSKDLVNKLEMIQGLNSSESKKMKKAAKNKAKNFDWEKIICKINNLLLELFNKK